MNFNELKMENEKLKVIGELSNNCHAELVSASDQCGNPETNDRRREPAFTAASKLKDASLGLEVIEKAGAAAQPANQLGTTKTGWVITGIRPHDDGHWMIKIEKYRINCKVCKKTKNSRQSLPYEKRKYIILSTKIPFNY